MAKRVHVTGLIPGTLVSDNGHWLLLRTKTRDGENLEIAFPHDLLPHLVDSSTSGWNVGAQRKGLGSNDRLTFELQGFEAGRTDAGDMVITMRFGENGSVTYAVSDDLAWSLLEGLKTELEPETFQPHTGLKH